MISIKRSSLRWLKAYLKDDTSLYVSVDPYLGVFRNMDRQKNLLRAYPSLREPCNFLAAHAEFLPFRTHSFDWVHMRSVVDHFADPYLAFVEAHRCCRPGGRLLVGLAIVERLRRNRTTLAGLREKVQREGIRKTMAAIGRRVAGRLLPGSQMLEDDHVCRLNNQELADLFHQTGWSVVKEHWQKPPFSFCLYLCGEAREHIPGR
ncbi:class I SAM-dependent methyltransferase [bacterium]|nr:class I SAM-dependent methyltransferase [bacterium]